MEIVFNFIKKSLKNFLGKKKSTLKFLQKKSLWNRIGPKKITKNWYRIKFYSRNPYKNESHQSFTSRSILKRKPLKIEIAFILL